MTLLKQRHERPPVMEVCQARRADAGQTTAFVVVCMAGLLLFAGLVLDGGLALAGKVAAADNAQEAARAATQQLDLTQLRTTQRVHLNRRRAVQAALNYLHATGDTGQAEASDDAVTVTATHHQHTQILSLIGINDLVTTATATARAERGISHAQSAPTTG